MKTSLKQIIFEREMSYKDHSLTFSEFHLPEDRGILFKLLDELYEFYGDNSKRTENKRLIRQAIKRYKDGRFVEVYIPSDESVVELNMNGDYYGIGYLEETKKVVTLPIVTKNDREKKIKVYFRCSYKWVSR